MMSETLMKMANEYYFDFFVSCNNNIIIKFMYLLLFYSQSIEV